MNAALYLRALARDTLLEAGGRGFVRFMPSGGALLCTDALRRSDAPDVLIGALEAAGFDCASGDGLLMMSPADALLAQITGGVQAPRPVDWADTRYAAQALGDRWTRFERKPLSGAGRALVTQTLRLCWQDDGHVLCGLDALRAHAADMLRHRDTSGLYEAGVILQGRMTADEA